MGDLSFLRKSTIQSSSHHHYFNDQSNPASNYIFKINNKNTNTRCEICSKLTVKTPERRQLHRSGVFTVNFEHISHRVLLLLLLTSSR